MVIERLKTFAEWVAIVAIFGITGAVVITGMVVVVIMLWCFWTEFIPDLCGR